MPFRKLCFGKITESPNQQKLLLIKAILHITCLCICHYAALSMSMAILLCCGLYVALEYLCAFSFMLFYVTHSVWRISYFSPSCLNCLS